MFITKKNMLISFSAILFAFLLISSCSESPINNNNNNNNSGQVVFDSLVARDTVLSVNQSTDVRAYAKGDSLTYKWFSSVGTITGSGEYIQFSICHVTRAKLSCTIVDKYGNSVKKEIYINAI